MEDKIRSMLSSHKKTVEAVLNNEEIINKIKEIAEKIINCYKNGGKVITFGNGGSASDAQHIATEFLCKLNLDRASLPALCINTNTSALTAISNDYDFSHVFSRQLESLVSEKDVAIGITTSGNSDNVSHGLRKAKEKGAFTILLTGRDGGRIAQEGWSDRMIIVPASETQRIQEMHITIGHIICELVESALYGE